MQQLRCCLAALCTRASQELGLAAHMDFPSPLRRQLFELLSEWSVDSTQAVRPGVLFYTANLSRKSCQRFTALIPLVSHHQACLGPVLGKLWGSRV